MSYLLPQSVRQNYNVRKSASGWELVCLQCKQVFTLDKPKSADDVKHLIAHTQAHEVIPMDERAPAKPSTRPPPKSASIPPVVENAYMVIVQPGKAPTITPVRLQNPLVSPTVDKHGNGYLVLLHAANPKHAAAVADRLVREYQRKPSGTFKLGTLRPPKAPSIKPPQTKE